MFGEATGDDTPVLLIATQRRGAPGGRRWGLPKGTVEAGESLEGAALREVREETGIQCEIVEPLDTIEYWFWWGPAGHKERHHKRVAFYLMRAVGGDTSQHDDEVLEACWFPIEEALQRASHSAERRLLQQAWERVRGGPAPSAG